MRSGITVPDLLNRCTQLWNKLKILISGIKRNQRCQSASGTKSITGGHNSHKRPNCQCFLLAEEKNMISGFRKHFLKRLGGNVSKR